MGHVFAIWLCSFLFVYPSLLFGEDSWCECDTSLVLSIDESEHFISMTGELFLRHLNRDSESPELETLECWIMKMNSDSFEIACNTPVRAAFHSPESIRESLRSRELELTGNYDKNWLSEHLGQIVTLSGYLWHAHTTHHHTPVMMDADPWFK